MCCRIAGPLSTSRLRNPGVRSSSRSIASATLRASTSVERLVPGMRLTSDRGRMTVTATPSVDLDGLDAPDRRQVVGDPAPALALVRRAIQLPGARAEVDPGRIAAIDGQRLAEDADIGGLLGQPVRLPLPAVAAVARPPCRERAVRRDPALLRVAERDDPCGRVVAWVRAHHEPELG